MKSVIQIKSYKLAILSIRIADKLKSLREYSLADQILRSGTSVGANVYESKYSESKKDFIHKLSIAVKEAHESKFWINLLNDSKKISEAEYLEFDGLLLEVIKILNSIIITTRNNLKINS